MRKLTLTSMLILALILIIVPSAHSFAQGREFTDIPSDNESARLIHWAVTNQIMTGYSDGTFRPDKPVTNAEYTAALMRLYGEPVTESANKKHWADDYYIAAVEQGEITWGFGDNKLRDAVMNIDHVRQVTDFTGDIFTRLDLVKYLKRFSEEQNDYIVHIVENKWL